jgi:hypothetical protein
MIANRPADAAVPALSDKSQLDAGDFDLLHDIFDRIDRRLEERERMAVIFRNGLVKAYAEGRVSAECVVIVDGRTRKWKLVFLAIKNGIECTQLAARDVAMSDADTCTLDRNGNKLSVCRIAKLVQGPEGAIPSLVWLEPFEDGYDCGRNIIADFSPGNKILEFVGTIGDRELRLLEPRVPRELGSGVGALVESRSCRLKNLHRQMRPAIRERSEKLEFVGLGASAARQRRFKYRQAAATLGARLQIRAGRNFPTLNVS